MQVTLTFCILLLQVMHMTHESFSSHIETASFLVQQVDTAL